MLEGVLFLDRNVTVFRANYWGGEMSKEYLEILAVQVLIFRNALLLNGANEETADKLTSVYIGACLGIAAQRK